MNLRYSLLGALALGLVSTVAVAAPADTAAPPPMDNSTSTPATSMPAADPSMPAAPADTGSLSNTSTTTTDPVSGAVNTTVSNGPVADTPENRRLYRPLSNAGRHTAARGN